MFFFQYLPILCILLKNTFQMIISVEVPENRPIIHGIKQRYQVGDSLRANCTSKNSRPAANLTWTLNDMPVSVHSNITHYIIMLTQIRFTWIRLYSIGLLPAQIRLSFQTRVVVNEHKSVFNFFFFYIPKPNPLYVRAYRIIRDHETHLETSIVGIQFVISQQYLLNNKLKVNSNVKHFSNSI